MTELTATKIDTIIDLKKNYPWLENRLLQIDIEHKKAIFQLCEKVPSILLHLDQMLKKMTWSELQQTHCWHVSKAEFQLLEMLALPHEDDIFMFTEALEEPKKKFILYDAKGNPIK